MSVSPCLGLSYDDGPDAASARALDSQHGALMSDTVFVDIPDSIVVSPAGSVSIPVTVDDVTGMGITALDMEICWCEGQYAILQYQGCTPGEVLGNSGWTDPACVLLGDDCITITATGVDPLVGNGAVCYINFSVNVNAKPCMSCNLEFTYASFSDSAGALAVSTDDGSVCVESCTIEGYARAWYCEVDGGDTTVTHSLEGVRLNLHQSGQPLATIFTDAEGYYMTDCYSPPTPPSPYCIDIQYWDIPQTITAYDASRVLCYVLCMDDLGDCTFASCGSTVYPQRVAADVNCTGSVTSYDASLILCYVVGDVPAFPCPDTWTWFADPCSSCMSECPVRIDFTGVAIGDVSGPVDMAPPGESDSVLVTFGDAVHSEEAVDVPVSVAGAYETYSMQLDIIYDTDDLYFISAVQTGLASGNMVCSGDENGLLRVAMAGYQSIAGDGDILMLTFGKNNPVPDIDGLISIDDAMINEGYPPVDLGAYAGVPAEMSGVMLQPFAPNPFRDRTAVTYSLPSPSRVVAKIYSVSGRHVCTLYEGHKSAGSHVLSWDGTGDSGQRVTRGIYFCHVQACGLTATGKIVLLD